MKPYGNKYSFKKRVSNEIKRSSKNITTFNFEFIHKIFNTINITMSILILILCFLSLNSQRQWSRTYSNLSKARANNNNLIDYISKTEEFYISEFEALDNFKKTTPRDLIYLEKIPEKKEKFFEKEIINIINGLKDSKYERGY